jgi:hypothetical protein
VAHQSPTLELAELTPIDEEKVTRARLCLRRDSPLPQKLHFLAFNPGTAERELRSRGDPKRCASCDKPENEIRERGLTVLLCTNCRTTYYCSTYCQREDWIHHKPCCYSRVITSWPDGLEYQYRYLFSMTAYRQRKMFQYNAYYSMRTKIPASFMAAMLRRSPDLTDYQSIRLIDNTFDDEIGPYGLCYTNCDKYQKNTEKLCPVWMIEENKHFIRASVHCILLDVVNDKFRNPTALRGEMKGVIAFTYDEALFVLTEKYKKHPEGIVAWKTDVEPVVRYPDANSSENDLGFNDLCGAAEIPW